MLDFNELFICAAQARLNAYVPYSNYLVGACIETDKGSIYSACNVENASYGLSICAESNAIAKMAAAGERVIQQIMVVVNGPDLAASCGACRQRLFEFATAQTMVHHANLHGAKKSILLSELLPDAFGPKNLDKR